MLLCSCNVREQTACMYFYFTSGTLFFAEYANAAGNVGEKS